MCMAVHWVPTGFHAYSTTASVLCHILLSQVLGVLSADTLQLGLVSALAATAPAAHVLRTS